MNSDEKDQYLIIYTQDNEYHLTYVKSTLHCSVTMETYLVTEIPVSVLNNLPITRIQQTHLHFNIKDCIIRNRQAVIKDGRNDTMDNEPNGFQIILNEINTSFPLQLQLFSTDYKENIRIRAFSNYDEDGNEFEYTIRSKYHAHVLKLLSLLYYIVSSSLKLRLTAHCLPHMLNTYFTEIPHDVAKLIFQFSLI